MQLNILGGWLEGQVLDRAGVESGKATLRAAITIADEADPPLPLVSHRVSARGVEMLVGA